jgi:hypothetical protein
VDGEMGMRCWNLRCDAATICGGRPGLFSLANDAVAASQPMIEIS